MQNADLEPTTPTDDEHSVVIRIVVYGPASAGKTTTARSLGEGLGRTIATPEEDEDGTTVYFDWMEHVGGRYNGRPILTQVLTVPGHDRSRRIALLLQADVVIYVADTSPTGMVESLALWEELRDEVGKLGTEPGIIVQANKRDHPAAVSIRTFRSWMGLDEEQRVIETVASDGDGVRQTYVFAVRAGLERLARHDDLDAVALDPAKVLADLSTVASEATVDRRSVTEAPAPVRAGTEAPASSDPTSSPEPTIPAEASPSHDPAAVAELATATEPTPTPVIAPAPAPAPPDALPTRPLSIDRLAAREERRVSNDTVPSAPQPTAPPAPAHAAAPAAPTTPVDPLAGIPPRPAPRGRSGRPPLAARLEEANRLGNESAPPPPAAGSTPLPPPVEHHGQVDDTGDAGDPRLLRRLFRGRRL